MHKVRIICVGRSHDKLLLPLINDYVTRLNRTVRITWQIMPPKDGSSGRGSAIATESNAILESLKPAEYVFLLDENGQQLSSLEFSDELKRVFNDSRTVVFIIGGAFGVSDELKKRADTVMAFGKMTMPHQLMRLVLAEQIYRAQNIASGGKYHHE